MAYSEDFSELFTNPGLIAKAIAAGMGNWAPKVGKDLYMRPGPRLNAIGDVLLAAREGAEQTGTAEEMARLAQGGGGGVPMPPTAGGRPAPQLEAGGPAAQPPVAPAAMPPGMSRAAMMAQLSPNAWRSMGRNRLIAANMDTLATAREQEMKQAAAYQAALPYFTATHGPEQGEMMARSLAQSGKTLDEKYLTTPTEKVSADRLRAQELLDKTKQEAAFVQAMKEQNINPLNPADFPKIDAITTQFPRVNPLKAFGGNVPAALAYMDQRLAGIRAASREKTGYDLLPTIESDENGEIKWKVVPGDAKMAMAEVRQSAQEHAEHLTRMVQSGIVPPQYAEGLTLALNAALRTGDEKALYYGIHNAGTFLATMLKANSDRDIVFGNEKLRYMSTLIQEERDTRNLIANNKDIMMAQHQLSRGEKVQNPMALQELERLNTRLAEIAAQRMAVLMAPTPAALLQAVAATAAQRQTGLPTPPQSTGAGGGVGWEVEKQRLIKAGKLNPNDPAQIEAARQYWLKATGRP
jgi:hypothetical protein